MMANIKNWCMVVVLSPAHAAFPVERTSIRKRWRRAPFWRTRKRHLRHLSEKRKGKRQTDKTSQHSAHNASASPVSTHLLILDLLHPHVVEGHPCSDPLVGSDLDAQHCSKDLLHHVVVLLSYTRIGTRRRVDFCPGGELALWALQNDGDVGFGLVPAAYQTRSFDPCLHLQEELLHEFALSGHEECACSE